MLIITGSGRSGTDTAARLLGGYHEFRVNYILDKYFLKADPHSDPFDNFKKRIAVILDLHQGIDGNSFIDSSNLYIYFIDAIYKLYPSAKIILTVRNGKDFVRSAYSRRWHERKQFGMVPLRNDPYFKRWESMIPLQKNAWIWDYRNRKAIEGLISVPEKNKLMLKIEEIENRETLDRLESFSGKEIKRDYARRRYNANPAFDFPVKEDWSDAMKAEFDEIAGEMMKYFGYR
ncbi:MAG: sulfotransferase [Nitrospirota bacterium]